MHTDVERSAIIGKPNARADVYAYLICSVLKCPRACGTGGHASLSGVLSELIERTIYRVDAYFSLVVGEEVIRVASGNTKPKPSSGWNFSKCVEV